VFVITEEEARKYIESCNIYWSLQVASRSSYGFFMLPNFLSLNVKKIGLKAADFLVYVYLCAYLRPGNTTPFPSEERIANDLGIGLRTVVRTIQRLVENGMVSVIKTNRKNGVGSRNSYDPLPGLHKTLTEMYEKDSKFREFLDDMASNREEDGVQETELSAKMARTRIGTIEKLSAKMAHEVYNDSKGKQNDGAKDKEEEYKSFIVVDEEEEKGAKQEKETSPLKVITVKALREGKVSTLLDYWRTLFETVLGRTSLAKRGPVSYGKLNTALEVLRTHADLMVIMEWVVDRRKENEPVWPKAEIRDPTLGLLAGSERLQGFLENIMEDEYWRRRRAKFNSIALGGPEGIKKKFQEKEASILLRELKRR
jgi:predicted transcriptional regulator